ncbi:MAG: methionine--tRNA ligase [Nanopusillaceae archaeon]|jgi:methionyl-tRNA synthetase
MGKDIVLITSALPYVNNVPHIGHLAGSLLPSDIFARYNRLKGNIVFYLCGTDDHGSATEVEAIKNNTKPENIVNFFHSVHKEIYKWFNLSFDNFSETSNNQIHYKIVQELFMRSFINGYIVEKEVELPYDPVWNKFLADRFVVGTCPYCGYENAKGDQCENCGRLLDPKDLINPRNAITGNPIIFRKTRHLYLNLTKLEEKIKEYVESKKEIFTDLAITMSLGWIKEGLRERSITRDLSFGVPVPYKELWEVLRKKIFNKLDFGSKEKFIDSFINALKEEGLIVPVEEILKIRTIVEENWPKVDSILTLYNYFEAYKNKVLYVWYDALIGYISFLAEKLKGEYVYDDVKNEDISNINVLDDNGKILKIKIDDSLYELEYKIEGSVLYLSGIYKEFYNLGKILKYLFENKKVLKIYLDINWKDFWLYGKIYHFLGKDNIPFHAVFWPAILLSSNNISEDFKEFFEITDLINFTLPYNVIGLSYLTYEGRKISKSQKWGIFCDALIKTNLNPDYWRFYISYILPYNKDTDFKWEEFKNVINEELVNNIGNLTHRVLSFIKKYYNGRIDGPVEKNIIEEIKKKLGEYFELMDKGELNLGLRKMLELSNYGNKIFQDNKPWENPQRKKIIVKSLTILLISLYTMLYPFIPSSSKKFFNLINYQDVSFDNLYSLFNFANNITIEIVGEVKPLFEKINDNIINELKEKATSPVITFS